MTRPYFLNIIILTILTTNVSYADIEIKSPEGGRLIFSQKKKGSIMKIIHGVKSFFLAMLIRQISVAATDII
ncbi:hypothetical protein [Klebsiella grimontii]|uniref:hypothetical protein n=1 Tax=Klebsiella grimontii TaxID=2058152 RepID=UPI0020C3172E|nr:hypothetical protein [Klebsiella grimontii]MEB7545992.1 hypothetical protein [Klebsiella grimontii]UTJ40132.1 hypothetical protein NLZ17_16120 [Klebsiella grimontii]